MLVGKRAHHPSSLLPKDYVSWLKNPQNNLCKKSVFGDLTFECMYKPIEYIICMEKKKEQISKSEYNQRRKELSDMVYFEFLIKLTTGAGDILKYKMKADEDYTSRVKYFAFDMQRDLTLEIDGEVMPCSLFHFERVFDLVPYAKFSIGFVWDNKYNGKDITLVYSDKIFNNGLIKYTYSKNEFKSIPKLETGN